MPRALTAVRAGWGAVLVLCPAAVAGAAAGGPVDRRAVTATRILGARHLLEAALTTYRPGPAVAAAEASVDAVHALTMCALAVADPPRRRLAITSAVAATGLAVAAAGSTRLAALCARPRVSASAPSPGVWVRRVTEGPSAWI